jgi:hypothetical protein
MSSKPLIRLYDAGGLGLIVLFPSGVLYSNQVEGASCDQPQAEGIYVPLVDEVVNQEEQLYKWFTGYTYVDGIVKLNGGGTSGIDPEDADAIDAILHARLLTSFISVDRSKLKESCEAWVYVKIINQPPERPVSYSSGVGKTASGLTVTDADYPLGVFMYPLYGFGECTGILTWNNSD